MSASVVAARKRRGVVDPIPAPSAIQSPVNQQAGFTLPQVIALVDKRLTTLETFMKDQLNTKSQVSFAPKENSLQNISIDVIKGDIESVSSEFNARYELLLTEINTLKDTVMRLQTYTMDVNKMLMEERVRILSDVDNTNLSIEQAEAEAEAEGEEEEEDAME
jgi:hypothetical protein